MNALSSIISDDAAPTVFRLRYTGDEIATMAKLLVGTIWASSPKPEQRFTAAEFVGAMTRMVGEPVAVPYEFERDGAELDLTEIALDEATTGDLLIFCDWDSPRPWHAGVMLSDSISDPRAQFVGCGYCQPVSTFWLAGKKWLPNLCRAYRFDTKIEVAKGSEYQTFAAVNPMYRRAL